MTEAKVEYLNEDDEALLRKLIDNPASVGQVDKFGNRSFPIGSGDGTSIYRLSDAGMISSSRHSDNLVFNSVTPEGSSYVIRRDKEIEAEKRRVQERKEDMHHDWKISVFTALVGVVAAIGGTFFGYWLGVARPFL